MVHCRDVPPPQSRIVQNSGYGYFNHASFINATTGWVAAWNPATVGVTIYRNSDDGTSWSSVSGCNHVTIGDTLIQLLTPSEAVLEVLEPSGPVMSLEVTTDAGETW